MLFRSNRKLRYLKYRSTNAYWLLRQRKFRMLLEMLKREAYFLFNILRNHMRHNSDVVIQSRSGSDSHTRARGALPDLPGGDSEYIDRHKLRSPSYRPTTLKRADGFAMQANPEAVQRELGRILSSVHVRVRS